MTHRAQRLAIAVPAGLLLVAALSGPAFAVDKWVTMFANEYRPRVVTINAGDRVTWVNDDTVEHDAVGNGWSTSLLGYAESDAITFTRAGTYRYRCSIHPTMTGTVRVRSAGGGTTPDTDLEPLGVPQDGDRLAQVLATLGVVMIAGTAVADRLLRRRSAVADRR